MVTLFGLWDALVCRDPHGLSLQPSRSHNTKHEDHLQYEYGFGQTDGMKIHACGHPLKKIANTSIVMIFPCVPRLPSGKQAKSVMLSWLALKALLEKSLACIVQKIQHGLETLQKLGITRVGAEKAQPKRAAHNSRRTQAQCRFEGMLPVHMCEMSRTEPFLWVGGVAGAASSKSECRAKGEQGGRHK